MTRLVWSSNKAHTVGLEAVEMHNLLRYATLGLMLAMLLVMGGGTSVHAETTVTSMSHIDCFDLETGTASAWAINPPGQGSRQIGTGLHYLAVF